MMNDFFYPSNSKIDEKELRYNEQNNFASPLALRHVEVPPPVLTEDTVFTSPTGEGTKSSTSLEQRRVKAIPSLLSCFKYQSVKVIKLAISRSIVRLSTDFPCNMPIVGLKYTVQYSALVET